MHNGTTRFCHFNYVKIIVVIEVQLESIGGMDIPKITTFLMFNNRVEEAVKLYTSLFEDSEIITMAKYGENGPGDPGTVQHSIFTLNGQVFMAIDANSGTELPMNPAISLFVTVKDTIEMERLFNGLKDEGRF